MARILNSWRVRELSGASRRLHLHFWHKPVEVLGEGGRVVGMRFERTEAVDPGVIDGAVRGTGEFVEYPLQAVYRAIGYFGSELPEVPFDDKHGVILNQGGRVVSDSGAAVPGLYATGWIKRGPVGLIGHTKSDALETITNLVADLEGLAEPTTGTADLLAKLTARGVKFTDWQGWLKLDAHERMLGETEGRERIKVVDRDAQVFVSNR
jgi:ferredoxin--NADP+ reductase